MAVIKNHVDMLKYATFDQNIPYEHELWAFSQTANGRTDVLMDRHSLGQTFVLQCHLITNLPYKHLLQVTNRINPI